MIKIPSPLISIQVLCLSNEMLYLFKFSGGVAYLEHYWLSVRQRFTALKPFHGEFKYLKKHGLVTEGLKCNTGRLSGATGTQGVHYSTISAGNSPIKWPIV